jgi:hypothetical protein
MNFARTLRLILALALLSAQHAALAHQIWHSGDGKTQPAQKQLCGQHDALSTVAGAVDGPLTLAVACAPADFSNCFIVLPAATSPGLAPSSRGPPASL